MVRRSIRRFAKNETANAADCNFLFSIRYSHSEIGLLVRSPIPVVGAQSASPLTYLWFSQKSGQSKKYKKLKFMAERQDIQHPLYNSNSNKGAMDLPTIVPAQ